MAGEYDVRAQASTTDVPLRVILYRDDYPNVGAVLRATVTGISAAVAGTTSFVSLAAVAVGSPALSGILSKLLAAVAAGVAGLGRTFPKTLAALSVGVVDLRRALFKTLAAVAAGVAGLTRSLVVLKALAVVAVGLAALGRVPGKMLAAVAVGVASLGRSFSKRLAASAFIVAGLAVLPPSGPSFITLAVVAVGVASLAALAYGFPRGARAVRPLGDFTVGTLWKRLGDTLRGPRNG